MCCCLFPFSFCTYVSFSISQVAGNKDQPSLRVECSCSTLPPFLPPRRRPLPSSLSSSSSSSSSSAPRPSDLHWLWRPNSLHALPHRRGRRGTVRRVGPVRLCLGRRLWSCRILTCLSRCCCCRSTSACLHVVAFFPCCLASLSLSRSLALSLSFSLSLSRLTCVTARDDLCRYL